MELSIRSSRESLSVMDTAITPATHTQNTHLLCRIMVKMKCKLITFEQNQYKHTIIHAFDYFIYCFIYFIIIYNNIHICIDIYDIDILFYLTQWLYYLILRYG